MKKQTTFILLLLHVVFLYAQNPNMPVILVAADNSVTYRESSTINVTPGSIMDKTGTLLLKPQSRAILYHDFHFVEVQSDQSPVEIASLFDNSEELVSKIEIAFGERISEAVYTASISGVTMRNRKALLSGWGAKSGSGKDGWGAKSGSGKDGWGAKSGSGKDGWGAKSGSGKDGWGAKSGSGKDGWGAKSGSGKDGWGEQDIKTRSSCPGGNYLEGINNIHWDRLKGTRSYQFVIEDMDNNIVFSTLVNENRFALDTREANLELDKEYAWYIHHPTKREVSTPVFFKVVDRSVSNEAISPLGTIDIYKKFDPATQALMRAFQLEEKGLLLSAQETYLNAIINSPGNSLARMMYAYFCFELGEVESAVNALRKKNLLRSNWIGFLPSSL